LLRAPFPGDGRRRGGRGFSGLGSGHPTTPLVGLPVGRHWQKWNMHGWQNIPQENFSFKSWAVLSFSQHLHRFNLGGTWAFLQDCDLRAHWDLNR